MFKNLWSSTSNKNDKMFDFEIAKLKQKNDKISDLEQEIKALKVQNAEIKTKLLIYESKEQAISQAMVDAVQTAQSIEKAQKNAKQIDLIRVRTLYAKLEALYNEVLRDNPKYSKDDRFKNLTKEFNDLFASNEIQTDPNVAEVTFKKMLSKSKRKGVTPETAILQMPKSSSGFDFNEALHPTDDLKDILKSFNLGDNANS